MVGAINALSLPRYGIGQDEYIAAKPPKPPTPAEAKQLADLSRAGKRLMGFCRTNLFKRLGKPAVEAFFSNPSERHILRNHVFLHAIDNNLPLPLGTQDSGLLDAANYDEDVDDENADGELSEEENGEPAQPPAKLNLATAADFKQRAAAVYQGYTTQFKSRFKWLRPDLFTEALGNDLAADGAILMEVPRALR